MFLLHVLYFCQKISLHYILQNCFIFIKYVLKKKPRFLLQNLPLAFQVKWSCRKVWLRRFVHGMKVSEWYWCKNCAKFSEIPNSLKWKIMQEFSLINPVKVALYTTLLWRSTQKRKSESMQFWYWLISSEANCMGTAILKNLLN